ncbi:MAG: hypothetical protein ABSF85_04950 [Terriglobales bacterium]|jgi:hypothetical protein
MKRYKRDNDDKINSLNRCYFDAEHGWVHLALDRLADVRLEFANDGQVEYCEALIRKDFLGQGAVAEEFFLKALRADPSHKFAAFNAAKYARSWDEFQRQAGVARIACAGDPDLQFLRQVEEGAQHVRYEDLLAQGAQEYQAHEKFGESAALAELSLGAGPHSLENELALRSGRALALRELDKAAANSRTNRGEGFPPDERLALKDAIRELGKAIELDPEDHVSWNFQSAWMILLCRWEEATAAADKALSLSPEGYLKPITNKATALAGKGQEDDARALAMKALESATKLGTEGSADRELAKHLLDDLARPVASDDEALAALAERITNGASLIARQEMAQWQNSSDGAELLKGLQKRCAAVGKEWSDRYIRIVSEMLIYFCPASVWISILKLSDSNSTAYEHCLYAAIYIAANDPGVLGRDACRFLVYLLLGAREPARIRRSYREAILGPAAAGSGAFAGLADRMRSELVSVNKALVKLVADQPPLTDHELEHACHITLSRFQDFKSESFEPKRRRWWSALFGG